MWSLIGVYMTEMTKKGCKISKKRTKSSDLLCKGFLSHPFTFQYQVVSNKCTNVFLIYLGLDFTGKITV